MPHRQSLCRLAPKAPSGRPHGNNRASGGQLFREWSIYLTDSVPTLEDVALDRCLFGQMVGWLDTLPESIEPVHRRPIFAHVRDIRLHGNVHVTTQVTLVTHQPPHSFSTVF